MLVMAAITVLWTTGVAFYARFLVALSKHCKPRLSRYWVSGKDSIVELPQQKKSAARAT